MIEIAHKKPRIEITHEKLFRCRGFGSALAPAVPHSPHPRCKVRNLLQLRTTSRLVCRFTNTYLLIPRLNELATHRLGDVRQWAKTIIDSGWIHQIWPRKGSPSLGLDGVLRCWPAYPSTCLLHIDERLGIPLYMRQDYFDKQVTAQREESKQPLGWIYGRCEDGVYCTLIL